MPPGTTTLPAEREEDSLIPGGVAKQRAAYGWATMELVATGLEAAARLRAPRMNASTKLVRRLSIQMSRELGLDDRAQRLVDICARVRDIGMMALPDELVLSHGALTPKQWELMNRHPALGAELLERLPGMTAAAKVVRSHHERWDGGGYPDGLAGEAIPLLSRVLAVADAFVALATDRPHRRHAELEVALAHIDRERTSQFDPQVVDALHEVLGGRLPHRRPRPQDGAISSADGSDPTAVAPPHDAGGISRSITSFDQIAAFTPACERALKAASGTGDVVGAIESDIGLTVAVLRKAQELPGRRVIANVPDAVSSLGPDEVTAVIAAVPRVEFPWRTAAEALIYHVRVHGQTVARAADRIAQELDFRARDDLIGAALLHDVGKLVVARAIGEQDQLGADRTTTPEHRVAAERRRLKLDHAGLGALLLDRWGMPSRLSDAVGKHHTADADQELATLVRLADAVAHHALGDLVDRRIMLHLAGACGLSVSALRDVLFDLPQSGSKRRRAEPSPLSQRETAALRHLAAGKVYKEIAAELGLSPSTIRSHLHSVYSKLEVEDRAQAVLRATEMGWI